MTPVALVPRINIQAFFESTQTVEAIQTAFADRRMARAHGTTMAGGIPAAIRLFQTQSTPNGTGGGKLDHGSGGIGPLRAA